MIIRILFFSLAFVCINITTFSQNRLNSIYAELGGNGVIYSINYERTILNFTKSRINTRIGVTTLGMNYIGFPLEANILFGESKHFYEMGLGSTLGRTESNYLGREDSSSKFYYLFTGRIGYRYVSETGFLLRVAFVPTYGSGFYPWAGISFGKSF